MLLHLIPDSFQTITQILRDHYHCYSTFCFLHKLKYFLSPKMVARSDISAYKKHKHAIVDETGKKISGLKLLVMGSF